MVKEIKVIDENNNEIKQVGNVCVLPVNGKQEFINVEQAENIIRILRGQINIIKAGNVSRRRKGEDTGNITRKTCGTDRGAE